jgi:transposase
MAKAQLIKRRWLVKLLYKPIDKVKEISEKQLNHITVKYPVVGTLYDIVQSFKEILSTKRVDELDKWIESAAEHNIDEINSFINGINSDLDAVKNAIRYDYNNGLAEGSINKLKVIKRIMYGRCSFNLLRNKVLLRE